MAQITWTNEAEHWLKEIHDYIAQDNPTAAEFIFLKKPAKLKFLAFSTERWRSSGI